MRLHRLTITAFGPFAGTERVDFDQLSSGGIFLLQGPTGAGKTSVLDSVCFALYGSVPGRRPTDRLRSDHTTGQLKAEVELEFSMSGKRYLVKRKPKQSYPSTRAAGGIATSQATVELHQQVDREDGTQVWEPVSAHVQDAGGQLASLIGLSKDQFCQVVLLPQGEFAHFLHARAGDRRELLSHLFNTGRFHDLQGWLNTRKAAVGRALADAEGTAARLESRLEQAAGPQLLQAVPRDADTHAIADLPGWAGRLLAQAQSAAQAAKAAQTETDDAHEKAKAAHGQAADLADRQARHEQARTQRVVLDELADHNQRLRTVLDQAGKAGHLRPLIAAQTSSAEQLRREDEVERKLRLGLDPAYADAPTTGLEQVQQDLNSELGRLEGLREREARHDEVALELANLETEEKLADEELGEAQEWLDQWPTRLTAETERIDQLRSAAEQAPHLLQQQTDAEQRLETARTRDQLAAKTHKAAKLVDQRNKEALQAWATLLDLQARRLKGMAAELAGQLQEGHPCVVCGSPDHPAPAEPSVDQPTRADEEAAATAHDKAKNAHENALAAHSDLAAQHAQALGAAGDKPVTELTELLDQARSAHADAQAKGAELVRAQQHLDELRAECSRREQTRERAQQTVIESQSRGKVLKDEQDTIAAVLDQARGDAPTLGHRITALTQTRDRLGQAIDQVRQAAAARTRHHDATTAALDGAAQAGFVTLDEAVAALQPEESLATWQAELDRWGKEDTLVAAQLADAALVAASLLPAADTAAAQAALTAAVDGVKARAAAVHESAGRVSELTTLAGELRPAVDAVAHLRDEHATVGRLADIASGTSSANMLSMELEAYVLATRLKDIVQAANVRLGTMTDSRFELLYSQDRDPGRGRTKAGLSLRILDTWTGAERETATLSGGETFTASLALALGLADIVTGESGGRPLETLFVDEGFGSLDEQSLTDVMDVLDQLRSGNRTVGVVSHVRELSDRIPTQLRVRKERRGSTLHTVIAQA